MANPSSILTIVVSIIRMVHGVCSEKPYMVLDLDKNIWSVKIEE